MANVILYQDSITGRTYVASSIQGLFAQFQGYPKVQRENKTERKSSAMKEFIERLPRTSRLEAC